jgi:HEPN domain-containing protein
MQLNPERMAETRAWCAKAALDLRAAEFEFTAQPPLTADIVFHTQQLVEKSLKGFLTWHDEPFRKTHNLVEIGQQCVAIDATLEDLMRRAARLTEYAWKFRYPGEPDEPPVTEAQEALALAHEVYEAVLSRLPAGVRL